MKDIDQLLTAHSSAVAFQRAQSASRRAGAVPIQQAVAALGSLVTPLGRGRRANVEAINRAAIVLLSAHTQGFIEDLYAVAAHKILLTKVRDLNVLVDLACERFRNPTPRSVEDLFCSIGLPSILDGIAWRKSNNDSVRKRLNEIVELRNRIAHGAQEPVYKAKVLNSKRFIELLAKQLDEKVGHEIGLLTGTNPW